MKKMRRIFFIWLGAGANERSATTPDGKKTSIFGRLLTGYQVIPTEKGPLQEEAEGISIH